MPRSCAALNCDYYITKDRSLRSFPTDKDLRNRWISNVLNLNNPNFILCKRSSLCDNHFEDSAWEKNRVDGKKKLKHNAVPTIFIESVDNPKQKSVNKRDHHNYARKNIVPKFPKHDTNLDDNESVINNNLSYCKNSNLINENDELPKSTILQTCTTADMDKMFTEQEIKINNLETKFKKTNLDDNESAINNDLSYCDNSNLINENNKFPKSTILQTCTTADLDKIFTKQEIQINNLKTKLKKAEEELKQSHLDILKGFFNNDQLEYLHKKKITPKGKTFKIKWSDATIIKGLKLKFSCGTSGYNDLRQHLPLPGIRTLQRSVEHIKFDSGILNDVFKYLKSKVAAFKHKQQGDCCLLLDEMAITKGDPWDSLRKSKIGYDSINYLIFYSFQKQFQMYIELIIFRYVSLPDHPKVLASKALVFIFAGLNSRWKQIVAYYFTTDKCDGSSFKPIIVKLTSLGECVGLEIHLVTSDMGPSNLQMWDAFGIVSQKNKEVVNCIPHPVNKDRMLYFMPDVAHLLKNLKSSLINNEIITLPDYICTEYELPSNAVRFSHIVSLIIYQEKKQLKLAKKLKVKDVSKNHFIKMSVVSAKHFFCTEVAAALSDLSQKFKNDKMKATIWFIKTMAAWFLFMSSRSRKFGLSLYNVEKYTSTIILLEEVLNLFKHLSIGKKSAWKPIQNGIILATKTVLDLSYMLIYERNYEFVLTGRFSQDAIENLFSCIRAPQPIPNALQFKQSLKLNAVSQYLKFVKNGNYEEDDREHLVQFPLRQNCKLKHLALTSKKEISIFVQKSLICLFLSRSIRTPLI